MVKEDLKKFDLEHVCKERRKRTPVFYSFLVVSAANKRMESSTWFTSLALAASIKLKQRDCEMSVTAVGMDVLLKSKAEENMGLNDCPVSNVLHSHLFQKFS